MIRKLVVLLLVGLFSAALLLGYGAWKYDAALKQPLKLTQEQLLDVPAGATPTGTFNRLEADGVLDGAFWLRLYWRFNLDGQPLHSGEYRLTPGMTAAQLLDLWREGDVVQYGLTLVEGWNFRRLREELDIRAWAVDDDIWIRRAAIICQVGKKGRTTDPALLADCIEANTDDRRFWITKAIGWAFLSAAPIHFMKERRVISRSSSGRKAGWFWGTSFWENGGRGVKPGNDGD